MKVFNLISAAVANTGNRNWTTTSKNSQRTASKVHATGTAHERSTTKTRSTCQRSEGIGSSSLLFSSKRSKRRSLSRSYLEVWIRCARTLRGQRCRHRIGLCGIRRRRRMRLLKGGLKVLSLEGRVSCDGRLAGHLHGFLSPYFKAHRLSLLPPMCHLH